MKVLSIGQKIKRRAIKKALKVKISILDGHPELKEIIEHKLSKKHSPEVIALEISKLYQDEAVSYKPCIKTIYNLIRAVTKPFPGAFFEEGGKKIIIWRIIIKGSRI